VLFCDGRRTIEVQPGDRVEVVRGSRPVRLVRLSAASFGDRLVEKFHLPVRGWRGPVEDE
jgi:NAD+ kinase